MVDAAIQDARDYGSHYFDRISETVGEFINESSFLNKLEEWTGIPGHIIITAGTAVALLLFLLSSGPIFILNIIMAMYPAYRSFKCLEAQDTNRCFKWMKFWIVYAAFHGAENIGDHMIWWIPGYSIIKFVFLVWCCLPGERNGASVIYDNYIHTVFSENAETVDQLGKKIKDIYNRFLS